MKKKNVIYILNLQRKVRRLEWENEKMKENAIKQQEMVFDLEKQLYGVPVISVPCVMRDAKVPESTITVG